LLLHPSALLLAAIGVFGTGTGWPDIIVAAIMAALALQGALIVVRQSLAELRQPVATQRLGRYWSNSGRGRI
jgi:Co/Zn/Cd efflux system component